jgi:hypothetical protein
MQAYIHTYIHTYIHDLFTTHIYDKRHSNTINTSLHTQVVAISAENAMKTMNK